MALETRTFGSLILMSFSSICDSYLKLEMQFSTLVNKHIPSCPNQPYGPFEWKRNELSKTDERDLTKNYEKLAQQSRVFLANWDGFESFIREEFEFSLGEFLDESESPCLSKVQELASMLKKVTVRIFHPSQADTQEATRELRRLWHCHLEASGAPELLD